MQLLDQLKDVNTLHLSNDPGFSKELLTQFMITFKISVT